MPKKVKKKPLMVRSTIYLLREDKEELERRAALEHQEDPTAPAEWQPKARALLHRAINAEGLKVFKFIVPTLTGKGLVKPAVIVDGVEVPIEASPTLGRKIPGTNLYVEGHTAIVIDVSESKARYRLHLIAESMGLDARWLAVADVTTFEYAPGFISWSQT